MNLESLLQEYGRSKNLGALKLDAAGMCTLLINDHYLITFEKSYDKEGFFIYSSIGILPPGKEKEISLIALKGNLFGKETGTSSVGLTDQNTLVLFEYFDENSVEYTTFLNRLNLFIQHLFYWILKLDSIEQINYPSSLPGEKSAGASEHKKIFYA